MCPAASREYEEFNPETRLVSEEGAEMLLVYLSDYKKEQLRVQLSPSRLLRISGERPLRGNKWQRFVKEVPVSPSCDTREITAKFEGGVLYVKQPKVMTSPEAPQTIPAPDMPPANCEPSGFEAAPDNAAENKREQEAELSKLADAEKMCGEEKRDRGESKGRAWNGRGIYKGLKNPDNLKMFGVIVVVAMALALHASYMNKVCDPSVS